MSILGGLFGPKKYTGLEFCVLGPSGSGKTTLLACLNDAFQRTAPGFFAPDDNETFVLLNDAYQSLKFKAEDTEDQYFSAAIPSTEDKREFRFHIRGKRTSMPVRFHDFPGGWTDPSNPNFETVAQMVRDSSVIIVAIKTPYLMEEDGKYDREVGADNVYHVLQQALLEDAEREHLILLVPVKCEKYVENDEDRERLAEAVKKKFDKTINLGRRNPNLKDRVAIAFIPVQTVGNAIFMRFKDGRVTKDGRFIAEEIYRKKSQTFSPQNADQPMRYMMRFLLRLFQQGNGSWWGKMLRKILGDLNEFDAFISNGFLPPGESSGIRVFCGGELLRPAQKERKGLLW